MEDTSLMIGTDGSAEHIWKNTCSPTRCVMGEEDERMWECNPPESGSLMCWHARLGSSTSQLNVKMVALFNHLRIADFKQIISS